MNARSTKILMPVCMDAGRGYCEVVKATLLHDIAPHLAHVATFALHRGAKCDTLFRRWWFVSNVELGMRVFYSIDRDSALQGAKDKLAKKSVRDVLKAYREKRSGEGVTD